MWGTAEDFYSHANETLSAAGISDVDPRAIIDIIDGYVGGGYGDTWPELFDFCLETSVKTGIFLDRVYTGKAVYGIREELRKNPGRFVGDKILFLHTGGIYGFIDGSMEQHIRKNNSIVDLKTVLH